MSKTTPKISSSSVELELQHELDNYQTAFKADAEFHVLKSIRGKIKTLESRLEEKGAEDLRKEDN